MDEHGCDFFSGAALSEDEDGDVGARNQGALGLDLSHAIAGSDKGGVLVKRDFLNVGVGCLFAGFLDVLLDGKVDIGFSKWLENYARSADLGGFYHFVQLGRTREHDDGKRRPRSVGFGEQAERVLLGAVLDNVPVHQEQVRGRRFLKGCFECRGL